MQFVRLTSFCVHTESQDEHTSVYSVCMCHCLICTTIGCLLLQKQWRRHRESRLGAVRRGDTSLRSATRARWNCRDRAWAHETVWQWLRGWVVQWGNRWERKKFCAFRTDLTDGLPPVAGQNMSRPFALVGRFPSLRGSDGTRLREPPPGDVGCSFWHPHAMTALVISVGNQFCK